MNKDLFPTFDICNLNAEKNSNELLTVDRFRGYVNSNPHLLQVHSHKYYHLVYFTQGSGFHLIDFEKFEVVKGAMYFMNPGQVHQWYFNEEYDGFVVNFSENFFDWIGINSSILKEFRFLQSIQVKDHVIHISDCLSEKIISYFQSMIDENTKNDKFSNLKIGFDLMNLFIDVNRSIHTNNEKNINHQSALLDNFQNLIEDHFKIKKLPKEYAELLYVTPNHLNALCKEVFGIPAGTLIRNRIILEAKRLLVNKEISVTEISYLLNFQDVSYFVKFFKKYTDFTPEQFRKKYYL